jgi:hypothetical protein
VATRQLTQLKEERFRARTRCPRCTTATQCDGSRLKRCGPITDHWGEGRLSIVIGARPTAALRLPVMTNASPPPRGDRLLARSVSRAALQQVVIQRQGSPSRAARSSPKATRSWKAPQRRQLRPRTRHRSAPTSVLRFMACTGIATTSAIPRHFPAPWRSPMDGRAQGLGQQREAAFRAAKRKRPPEMQADKMPAWQKYHAASLFKDEVNDGFQAR